ncbi:hypothetical protein [Acinetobacter sp. YH12142]|uniref:hypothetical protein n=1 Tax=Acinetobacter sp. YH12142 TaxID=2601126 RepID=UPI0015D3B3EC|nr:hypothetical protein [Acinetobacter sp. YH12142]
MSNNLLVTFHKLNAQVLPLSPTGLKPNVAFNLLDFFENLKAWNYENFQYPFSSERFCGLLGVIDVDRSQNVIRLVFVVADKDADPQCARDLATNQTRLLARHNNEAADQRVHVVLKVNPTAPFLADVGIEHIRGVSIRILMNTLNYLARHARLENPTSKNYFIGEHPTDRFERGDKIGLPKPLGFKINFLYESVLSDEIVDAFINGKVKNVEFSQQPQVAQQWDNQGIFTQNLVRVNLKVSAITLPSNIQNDQQKENAVKGFFRNLIGQHSNLQGTLFKIKFEDAKGDPRLAEYNPDDDVFVLVKKDKLPDSLRQAMTAHITLNRPLCDKIQSKL